MSARISLQYNPPSTLRQTAHCFGPRNNGTRMAKSSAGDAGVMFLFSHQSIG